jgi:SAM-dependent methyltransferase/diadenosine tetraphosphate (Ap4A) HIT family hydrolase
MTIGVLPDRGCEMCEEVDLSGSRLILRTPIADVVAGLGALTLGYSLVVPHRHAASLGELSPGALSCVFDIAWKIAGRVQRKLGHEAVLVEHGSSGIASRPGGACIVHAHLHIFPLPRTACAASFRPPGSEPMSALTELNELARQGKNYYFCAATRNEGFVLPDPQLPSQFARRQWARSLDLADYWDWAAFPLYQNSNETAALLSDSEAEESLIQETLLAYSSAKDSYADRTRAFTPESTLPREIREFSESTRGTVLDAGSGAGRDSLEFAANDREVFALDACAALLAATPQHDKVTTIPGDVRRLPLSDSSVGAVWCSAVLLHLPHHQSVLALREFSRVLAPSGLAQISVKEGQGSAALPMEGSAPFRRHFFFYQESELMALAEQAGLQVVRTWYEDEVDSDNEVQRWIKVLLRRRP